MKTKETIQADILSLTMKIEMEFPELSKYIAEMPHKIPTMNTVQIGTKNFEDYYNSLFNLYTEYANSQAIKMANVNKGLKSFPGYPLYPSSEDIYSKSKKEGNIDPEAPTTFKSPVEVGHAPNEKDFDNDHSGDDLDVPGAELDNEQESIGSEDEENNYYSLGGDDHIDLDEE